MRCHIHCRNYYALANLGLVKLLYNPSPVLPIAHLKAKKDVGLPVKISRPASDTFDIFVDELVHTKSVQWKSKSERSKKLQVMINQNPSDNMHRPIRKYLLQIENKESNASKNDIFYAAERGDFNSVSIMLNSAIFSDINIGDLDNLARIFAEAGSIKGVTMIVEIATEKFQMIKPHFYEQQLRCLKQRGENTKALSLCEELYVNNPSLRREVRGYLSHVLIDIVGLHSEAALVQGKYLVEQLSIKYKDFRPVSSLWHACFLSEWFSDQQVASQLLAYIVQQQSMQTLERRMMAATYTALAQHRPQLVHGLIQDLLSCKVQIHLTPVLRALFDYKCSLRDLKSCAAIVRTSLDINVSLTSQQHTRLLDLLCQQQKSPWLHGSQEKIKPSIKPKSPPPFQLKF